ncbi:MAG: FAD-binding protein [Caldimicrobium sp.]|nr:FAD-binding protein [Caldimicrobium sp.]MCX7873360.1 FAD-binding protein [Caldimicrobium sp.]MDW8093401.1 FAD-linked oxidase C-terminal domain-containing protein [Caldimicrobium sp.]
MSPRTFSSTISEEALKNLQDLLGDRFLVTEEEIHPYAFDASSLCFFPPAVALPETKEEVLEILRLADKYNFPITPRGSGTATTGSALPIGGGLVVSFTRMNRILEINSEERTAVVEPGVLNGDLKRELKKYNLFYPPDPASYTFSTIGGNVATGAGGPRGLKYGTTKDYVLSLLVGLPGGQTLRTGPGTLKGVVPYNITPLFVGSEGTLGVFLEIQLKLLPLPEKRALFLIYFPEELSALKLGSEILLQGITPACAEFVDKTSILVIKERLDAKTSSIEGLLFLEFDGTKEEVEKVRVKIREILGSKELFFQEAEEELEIEKLWEIRRVISPSLRTLGSKKISDDVVIPRRGSLEFIKFLRNLEKETGVLIAAYGHAGDGNFHVNLIFDEEHEKVALQVREAILRKVLDLAGTLSGEHGVGFTKRSFVVWELNDFQLEIMRKIKALFDPKGLLNPNIKLP